MSGKKLGGRDTLKLAGSATLAAAPPSLTPLTIRNSDGSVAPYTFRVSPGTG